MTRILSVAFAMLATMIFYAIPALAQTTTSTTTESISDLWTGLVPYISAAVGAVIRFLVG
jgi:hypothetical protein